MKMSQNKGMKNKSTKFGDRSMTEMPKRSVSKDATRGAVKPNMKGLGPRTA